MINFPQGFQITSQEPIDNRLVMTKAEMLAVRKTTMPEKYLTICKDDGEIYVYDSSVESDPETGRFRISHEEIREDLAGALADITELNRKFAEEVVTKEGLAVELPGAIVTAMGTPAGKEALENAVSETLPGALADALTNPETKEEMTASIATSLPGALGKVLAEQDNDSGLAVDKDGNISVQLNEDHLAIIDNKIELAISVIEAIDGN